MHKLFSSQNESSAVYFKFRISLIVFSATAFSLLPRLHSESLVLPSHKYFYYLREIFLFLIFLQFFPPSLLTVLFNSVFLNRSSTESLVFNGDVSGVRWKSFKILTLSGAYTGDRLILGGKLDVGRPDDLFLVFT